MAVVSSSSSPLRSWDDLRCVDLGSSSPIIDHAFVQTSCLDIRFVNVARIWSPQPQNGNITYWLLRNLLLSSIAASYPPHLLSSIAPIASIVINRIYCHPSHSSHLLSSIASIFNHRIYRIYRINCFGCRSRRSRCNPHDLRSASLGPIRYIKLSFFLGGAGI